MDILISHQSAAEYWRLPSHTTTSNTVTPRQSQPPVKSAEGASISRAINLGLSMPVHVLVSDGNAKRLSRSIITHTAMKNLPANSVINIDETMSVSSPELCFIQMASVLPLTKLIELGFELCGCYSMPSSRDSDGFYSRSPLASHKSLSTMVNRASGMQGREKARIALRYILEGSASPMETILAMLLTLPFKYGGYGFTAPRLNSRIIPIKTAKRLSVKSFYSCDLYWPEAKVAVEYDSDAFHTGPERIASDTSRRNALALAGIQVITVTSQQLRSIAEFEGVARLLAKAMGRRLRYKNPGFTEAQRELRRLLL